MTECIILAGGMGTRLRNAAGNTPKPMIMVEDRPFLEILLSYVKSFGIEKFIFSVGYGADQIEKHFGDGTRHGVAIQYSRESEKLLGTGGALKRSLSLASSERVLALNGDSICLAHLGQFFEFDALVPSTATILGVHVDDTSRFGTMGVEGSHLVEFKEKTGQIVPGLINAGVYVLSKKDILDSTTPEVFSIERDYFEKLPPRSVKVFEAKADFIDIGVPEDLSRLPEFIHRNKI